MKGCGEDKRCTVFAHLFFDSTGSIHVNEPLTRRRRAMAAHLPHQEGLGVAGRSVNDLRSSRGCPARPVPSAGDALVCMLHGETGHASVLASAHRQDRIPLP